MAKQRYKKIKAGRLVREVLWTASFPSDTPKQRAEKTKLTTAARKAVNVKCAWKKLMLILAENFGGEDFHVVLTYDDAHLPSSEAEAVKVIRKFIVQLRQCYRSQGQELFYIYKTEHLHDGRLHHHLIVNSIGKDEERICSLWEHGSNIDFSQIDEFGYAALAQYFTKEAKDGILRVGARSWVPSLNLKKPNVQPTEWVPDSVRLQPPSNAHILEREEKENEFGRFQFIEYLLPKPPKQTQSRPRKPRKKRE